MTPRHLAITMGDPAGIGPEIIVKACRALAPRLADGSLRLLVIGHGSALERARAAFAPELTIPAVAAGDAWPALAFLQAGEETSPIEPGVLSPEAGRFAYLAIEQGVRLAQAGRVGGLVTPGVPRSRLQGGAWDGVAIISKSGGFGPDALWRDLLAGNGHTFGSIDA